MRQSYFQGLFPTLERRDFFRGTMWLLEGLDLNLTGLKAQRNIV